MEPRDGQQAAAGACEGEGEKIISQEAEGGEEAMMVRAQRRGCLPVGASRIRDDERER